ncbi:MAG: hypothetical protein V1843_00385 [bacterium]
MPQKKIKGKLKKEHFEVLLEHINHEFKAVAEGHDILSRKIDTMGEQLNKKSDEVDHKLEFWAKYSKERADKFEADVNKRFDRVEEKLDCVAEKVEGHDQRITALEPK